MEISLQASNAKLRRYSFVTAKTEQAESRLFPPLEIFIHFEKLFRRFMEIPRNPLLYYRFLYISLSPLRF